MTHMVGPGDLIDDPKGMLANEVSSFAVGASLAASKNMKTTQLPMEDIIQATLIRARLGRFDPISTFSFMLQINEVFRLSQ